MPKLKAERSLVRSAEALPKNLHWFVWKCGAVLKEGQAFCPSCGTKQEKPCPSCGAVMESDAKFCPVCGASGDDVKLCPNCKAEIKGNAAFCSKCGTKNQLKIRAVPKTTVTPVFYVC